METAAQGIAGNEKTGERMETTTNIPKMSPFDMVLDRSAFSHDIFAGLLPPPAITQRSIHGKAD